MKVKPIFFLSGLPVLAAGAGLFYWQTRQLRHPGKSAPVGEPGAASEPKTAGRQGPAAPPELRRPASQHQVIEKLENRIITAGRAVLAELTEGDDTALYHTLFSQRELTKDEEQKCWEAVLARRESWTALTGASLEERKIKGAEIETRFETTLASIMGADWAATRQAAQDSVTKATAEYLASKTETRVNDAVALTPAQKDALHAAVLARNPTDATLPRPPYLRRFFMVDTRPTPPGLSEEQLGTVLSEEQVNLFALQYNASVKRENATIRLAMEAFLPALIEALTEAAGPRTTSPAPAAK